MSPSRHHALHLRSQLSTKVGERRDLGLRDGHRLTELSPGHVGDKITDETSPTWLGCFCHH